MLSATELASMYGLYTLKHNPNGLLVSQILADYVQDTNLNVAEYYYPHNKGVMRVYPEIVYTKPLFDFCFDLEDGDVKIYVAKYEKKKINFVFKKPVKIVQYGQRKEN